MTVVKIVKGKKYRAVQQYHDTFPTLLIFLFSHLIIYQAPEPAHSWNGVLDAEHYPNQCLQGTGGNEDCLYLNVFTPSIFFLKY